MKIINLSTLIVFRLFNKVDIIIPKLRLFKVFGWRVIKLVEVTQTRN